MTQSIESQSKVFSLMSSVDRPINFLKEGFDEKTMINERWTFIEFKIVGQLDNVSIKEDKKYVNLFRLKFILTLLVLCLLFSLIGTAIQIDFTSVNAFHWALFVFEFSVCPSFGVLAWKVTCKRKMSKDAALQNMTSFSLDLTTETIKNSPCEFKSRYKQFISSFGSSLTPKFIKDPSCLDLISEENNPRLCLNKLSSSLNKVTSPLSGSVTTEVVLFIGTLIAAIISFVVDLLNQGDYSLSKILANVLTLGLALAVSALIGYSFAKSSHQKALSISFIRYLFYSYMTDSE